MMTKDAIRAEVKQIEEVLAWVDHCEGLGRLDQAAVAMDAVEARLDRLEAALGPQAKTFVPRLGRFRGIR